ncbi:PAS domain-containing hybrid sensor histidine kinase/response regulator [Algoriphagus ratkowskyi]|nr:PAS domain-containing hybrid sensor histidine kinase/response regulator [Algoriphagus ratkowskyi]TXD75936.1 PAS domain-containing sensor histidine kinase [Algoriphagus ratkowskyi]
MSNSPLLNSKILDNSSVSFQDFDPDQDNSLIRINKLASVSCETMMSVIGVRNSENQWFRGGFGYNFQDNLLLNFIHSYALNTSGFFEFSDLSKINFPEAIGSFFSSNDIKFLAGLQVRDEENEVIGFLVILDKEPKSLSEGKKEVLELLAEDVAFALKEGKLGRGINSFEKLFNISHDLICIAGTDGFFKKINPSFTKLLGWTEEVLLTRSFFELVHKEDLEKTKLCLQKLASGESTINFIHRFQHENGTYKILEWVATPEEKSGELYAIARDITEVSKRDLEVAESEKRQRIFFKNSQGFMCTHDMQGNLLSVNKAGASMLGYSEEEVLGMSLYDIVPDYRHEAVDIYLKAIESEGKLNSQIITKHKNGEEFIWMFNNVLEKSSSDDGYYVIGNAVDVTSRVKLEEDLRQTKLLLEETGRVARVGGWNFDLQNQKVTWTPMTKLIHELDLDYVPDLATGINFYKEGPSRENILKALDSCISEGKSWDLELQIITNLGNEIWVRALGHAEFKNDVCIRVFGTFQDIDESKKAQLELERTKNLAEEASIAKSEFLANMSHEIRTPLNGVIGFTDLVLKTNLNETQHQYLSIVNQSGNALLSIINDILDFSKIEAGKLELDVEKCDLYEMCSQATDIITYQIQSKGLEMLLNISTELPRFAYTDSVRLKQILVNLLGNASKFTEKGEIELKIENLAKEGDKHKMRFSVRDTGIGIKPDKRSKIFEAFSQEDSSTTKRYGGTGLGLTISNSLLRLMNSQLNLDSVSGEGSVFYFDLSLKTEEGDAIATCDLDKIKKVLIVDDNENNRLIVRQMLLLKNIQSSEAKNGFEALQLLASGESFDVVLMDYHMPFMDGLETIRKMRENFPVAGGEQSIMLLHSSSDDQKIIDSCRELHVKHRLLKPLKIQDFYHALSKLNTPEAHLNEPLKEAVISPSKVFTVLVAEDNMVNMLLARTIINKIAPNATMIEVINGLEALEYCQNQFPDIILMDVQMPEMNGYEATRNIRQLEKDTHVPIIAFTAGNVKGEREKCLAAGMDDFVVKPVVEETVVMILNKWLDSNVNFMLAKEGEDSTTVDSHYNPAKLKNYTDHDPKVLEKILSIVKSELKGSLTVLHDLIEKKEIIGINELGHKLYGTASSAGMNIIANMAIEFEKMERFDEAKMNSMYEDLVTEINLVLEMMDR